MDHLEYTGVNPTPAVPYCIILNGIIDSALFADLPLRVTSLPAACTLLAGSLSDQGALFGVLQRIASLGITLIAVQRLNFPAGDTICSEIGGTYASNPA